MSGSVRKPHLAKRVFFELRGHRKSLSLIVFLELLSTPLSLLSPIGIKIAVDNVVGQKSLPHLLRLILPVRVQHSSSLLLVAAIVIQLAVVLLIQGQWFCNYLLKIRSGERILVGFRSRIFDHLQHLPLHYHDSRGTSDSAFRVQDDAAALKAITIDGALFLTSDIVKLVAMSCVTLMIDWRLGVVALSVAPLLCLYALVYQRRIGGRYKEVKKIETAALQVVHETLSIIRVVKAFVQEKTELSRFIERSQEASDARIRLGLADALFGLAVNLSTAAGMAMVLYVGIRNVESRAITLGSLLLIITYLVQLYAPLQNITYHLASLKSSAAGIERALDVFSNRPESPAETYTSRGADTKPRRAFGAIEFENVSFAYGAYSPVLNNFSLEIPAGSRVGIIGRTGAGKTTLVNLLMRFIYPESGRILLDGHDVQTWDLSELRKQFAFVLQEPVLFSTTIAENIAYGRPHASREEIIQAAKAASAHNFIESLPLGYDTTVGERGATLSGGERQRICIARAFLQNAPILILDEPTSSLDVNTEEEVLKTLDRLSAGRTCIVISHRLNALASCDFIFKLNRGFPVDVSFARQRAELESVLREELVAENTW